MNYFPYAQSQQSYKYVIHQNMLYSLKASQNFNPYAWVNIGGSEPSGNLKTYQSG